jgi:isoleucyl-tRNA synthetase
VETYYFFTLYAGDVNPKRRTDSSNVLDRYLLAKTRQLIDGVTEDLEALDSPMAAAKIRDFADVLTNWYVRRSRDRFWDGNDADAVDTLYTVLETVCRIAAPLAPLVTEEVWRGLTGGESVHLADWPDASEFPADHALVMAMDRVREVASAGLALRKAQGLRVRLPLANLTVVVPEAPSIPAFADILREELNVKTVSIVELREESVGEYGITRRLSVNSRHSARELAARCSRSSPQPRRGIGPSRTELSPPAESRSKRVNTNSCLMSPTLRLLSRSSGTPGLLCSTRS